MARDIDPKCKKCRRAGEKLFLKGERCESTKCALVKRNYPPGQHGQKGMRRLSDYGLQLKEKQKAKRIYGILERQFRNYYEKAIRMTGKTGETISQLLETRLDNVVFRGCFAKSRGLARQLVSHGSFTVNGKSLDIPSYQVKVNDLIAVKVNKAAKSKYWQELVKNLAKVEVAEWLQMDPKNLSIKVLRLPGENDFEKIIDMSQIVEIYSK